MGLELQGLGEDGSHARIIYSPVSPCQWASRPARCTARIRFSAVPRWSGRVKTVERHRSNILGKLGMRDRTELTRYAIRAGLIEP